MKIQNLKAKIKDLQNCFFGKKIQKRDWQGQRRQAQLALTVIKVSNLEALVMVALLNLIYLVLWRINPRN